MEVRIIEFLFNLFPHVVEDVFTLSSWLELVVTCVVDALAFCSAGADGPDSLSCIVVDGLAVL